jgi:glycine/D-amino acid oxidase-like deaminating enzyme/nitrite reductase/ring-hydroxylating ferredoxin subunit
MDIKENDFEYEDKSGNRTSGSKNTFWINSAVPISYSQLQQNLDVDVVVVGGGIAGVTTAYLLLKSGRSVAIVEDGYIGSGETGRTTAHIVNALDDRYYILEELFGEDGAKLAAESHTTAISQIEQIVVEENINCDFERLDGYLFLHQSDTIESLQKELEATQRAGIKTEWLEKVPGLPAQPGPCIKFPNQAQFHPMKYLKGVCDAIISMGGMIFTNTHAKKIQKTEITTSEGFKVKAKHIVVATNTPVNNVVAMHTKQAPYRTYVIGAKVPKGLLPKALWWDTGDKNSKYHTEPYHYVRLHNYDHQYDLLIIGGEDHKTGQDEDKLTDHFSELKNWAMTLFPIKSIEYKWSGQVMEPVDYLAFIGRNPMDSDNVYIITGDSGNGITHGTIAGIMICDMIGGKSNPWEKIYDPSRINTASAKEFIEENLNVVKQYKDLFTGSDDKKEDLLPLNCGTVIRSGIKKLALYRDDFGELHAYNAICPHLKCVVHWNQDEKSFDCPCHGSRFTCYGKVVNGPANADLSREKVPDDIEAYLTIHAQYKNEKKKKRD